MMQTQAQKAAVRATALQLSRELRQGQGEDLTRRRWIIGLSMVGTVMAQIVTAYQTGLIRHLPDPPFDVFDADKVDASAYAYKRFAAPDGVMMLTNYGVTAWLAATGGQDRQERHPLLSLAMGLKILGDAGTALQLAREEWQENRRLCAYCQVATLVSLASAALALPETVRAARTLLKAR